MDRAALRAAIDALSPRERELLVYAAHGLTDQAIANRVGISLATVGTYWGRIRTKMGPLNRTELVALFLQDQSAETVDRLRTENQRLMGIVDEERKHAMTLQSSLEMFRGLIESAPDAILLISDDGVIQFANEKAAELALLPQAFTPRTRQ